MLLAIVQVDLFSCLKTNHADQTTSHRDKLRQQVVLSPAPQASELG